MSATTRFGLEEVGMHRRLARLLALVVSVATLASGTQLAARQSPRRPGPEARVVDPKAVAVLEAMDAAFQQAHGLTATYRSETFRPNGQASGVETVTLRLGRPNVYFVTIKTGAGSERALWSDGATRFDLAGTPGRCTTSDVAPNNDSREITTFNPIYWSFYDLGQWQIRSAMLGHWVTRWRLSDPGLRTLRYLGREDLSGSLVDVIEWTYTISYSRPEDDPVYTSRLSIGADHFPRRIETTSMSKNDYEGRRIVETIDTLTVRPFPDKKVFALTPPAGVTCTKVNQEDVYTTGRYADLPIGSTAPDFTLKTSRGETIRFSEFLKQHKVVLMNYWGYG
jgi:hypothetical protein